MKKHKIADEKFAIFYLLKLSKRELKNFQI